VGIAQRAARPELRRTRTALRPGANRASSTPQHTDRQSARHTSYRGASNRRGSPRLKPRSCPQHSSRPHRKNKLSRQNRRRAPRSGVSTRTNAKAHINHLTANGTHDVANSGRKPSTEGHNWVARPAPDLPRHPLFGLNVSEQCGSVAGSLTI